MRICWLAAGALLLAGCTGPAGVPADSFLNPEVAAAYIPLDGTAYLVLRGGGAGVALGNGLAVSTAHTANLIDSADVVGTSADYDLLFFRTARKSPGLVAVPPAVGERVIAYGQYKSRLRRAEGVVTALDAPVKPQCDGCAIQIAFTFEGNAGPGFSGGPVIDATSGRLLGVVFGYIDKPDGGRIIYAYDMARVMEELKKIEAKLPAETN